MWSSRTLECYALNEMTIAPLDCVTSVTRRELRILISDLKNVVLLTGRKLSSSGETIEATNKDH